MHNKKKTKRILSKETVRLEYRKKMWALLCSIYHVAGFVWKKKPKRASLGMLCIRTRRKKGCYGAEKRHGFVLHLHKKQTACLKKKSNLVSLMFYIRDGWMREWTAIELCEIALWHIFLLFMIVFFYLSAFEQFVWTRKICMHGKIQSTDLHNW